MYDTAALMSIMEKIEFDARPRNAFDSDIPGIDQIESSCRTGDAVVIEGRKTVSG